MTNLTSARLQFFRRFAVVTCAAGLALSACANTGSTANGTATATDTASGGKDTASGGDSSTSGGDSAGGDASTAGTEKSIVDLQKASEACPSPEPQTWGEAAGVTIREAVVTTPTKKQTSDGGLIGVFVQQKGGGQYSGIYVIASKTSEISQVKPGDIITVTGDVKDYYCATQISNKFATIESGTAEPVAVTVTTDDIGDIAGKVKTEPYEGVLVQLHDVVVGPEALGSDGKPHGDYYIGKTKDDKALRMGSAFYGVYLSDKDGTTFTPKYPTGTKLGTVTGVLEYSFGAYRLVISKDPEGVVKP